MDCYKRTNITGEKVVNPHKTQLNDVFIASGRSLAMKMAAQKNKKAEH